MVSYLRRRLDENRLAYRRLATETGELVTRITASARRIGEARIAAEIGAAILGSHLSVEGVGIVDAQRNMEAAVGIEE